MLMIYAMLNVKWKSQDRKSTKVHASDHLTILTAIQLWQYDNRNKRCMTQIGGSILNSIKRTQLCGTSIHYGYIAIFHHRSDESFISSLESR